MLDRDRVNTSLVRRGLRLTAQRVAILEAIDLAEGSFTAQQLHDTLRRTSPDLGLTTVYRTLDILAEAGAVERVHGLGRCEAFVAAGRGHSHTIVCSSCGAATELLDCGCDELVAAAARQSGYRIDDHLIQLSGICERCFRESPQSRGKAESGGKTP